MRIIKGGIADKAGLSFGINPSTVGLDSIAFGEETQFTDHHAKAEEELRIAMDSRKSTYSTLKKYK